jgi:hypothetical protein
MIRVVADPRDAMRTTLNIDPDILRAAREIAVAKSLSMGAVISDLARRGLEGRSTAGTQQGFPAFQVTPGVPPLAPTEVRRDKVDP